MTRKLTISYDDAILLDASMSREDFEREALLLLAAKLYELGRLSSGKAAEFCGMQRVEFLLALPRVGGLAGSPWPRKTDWYHRARKTLD